MQITLRPIVEEKVRLRAKEEDRSPTYIVNRMLEKLPSLQQERDREQRERTSLADMLYRNPAKQKTK